MNELVAALRLIAEHFDGEKGVWAYDTFDMINAEYFDGDLPTPKIEWRITPHGGCLGLTRSGSHPVIALHPSILRGTESDNPWGVDPAWLGTVYAFDVLLHESIHVAQHCLHGGGVGPTSHNNTAWIAEVNRLAPLLGFNGVTAVLSKTKRVAVDGQFTKTGKPLTKPQRISLGGLPHKAIATFPEGVRMHLGTADQHYRGGTLPVTGNYVLQEATR